MVLGVPPSWAGQPAQAIRDVHAIAGVSAEDPVQVRARAVVDTLEWVTGQAPSPLQALTANTVSQGDVEDELRLAQKILSGPEQLHSGDRAHGVGRALSWLLGLPDAAPPVAVPERNPDGTVKDATQLYTERIASYHWQTPERKLEVRAAAGRDAARYRQLAALVDSV